MLIQKCTILLIVMQNAQLLQVTCQTPMHYRRHLVNHMHRIVFHGDDTPSQQVHMGMSKPRLNTL